MRGEIGRAAVRAEGVGWGEKACRNTIGREGVCVCVCGSVRCCAKKLSKVLSTSCVGCGMLEWGRGGGPWWRGWGWVGERRHVETRSGASPMVCACVFEGARAVLKKFELFRTVL